MEEVIKKGGNLWEEEEQKGETSSTDSATALQTYLNRIPVSSIPSITHSPVLEVNAGDSVRDAIELLYAKNASVALITDFSSDNSKTNNVVPVKLSDRYVGVINFATMVLWCIERLQKDESHQSEKEAQKQAPKGFFSMLEQNPHINQTKVAELAKSFLWEPFFPVHLEDDTLFHVLLLIAKHPLNVVPVIERSKHQVIGFITQTAVIKLLLQSSGLEWFDSIANVTLSEFSFERRDHGYQVYADQSISEVFSVLSENRSGAVAVVDRKTEELVGTVRNGDISLLLNNAVLFANTKITTVEEFMKVHANKEDYQRIKVTPRMDSPAIHREINNLKQVMEKMAETNSECSFIVDGFHRVTSMLSLRDIIVKFAPPCVDSRIGGGGFFESALQQSGCHIEKGTMVYDH